MTAPCPTVHLGTPLTDSYRQSYSGRPVHSKPQLLQPLCLCSLSISLKSLCLPSSPRSAVLSRSTIKLLPCMIWKHPSIILDEKEGTYIPRADQASLNAIHHDDFPTIGRCNADRRAVKYTYSSPATRPLTPAHKLPPTAHLQQIYIRASFRPLVQRPLNAMVYKFSKRHSFRPVCFIYTGEHDASN